MNQIIYIFERIQYYYILILTPWIYPIPNRCALLTRDVSIVKACPNFDDYGYFSLVFQKRTVQMNISGLFGGFARDIAANI